MPGARALAWLERLIWLLIYGGLFALVLGLATDDADAALGWALTVGGLAVALAGVALIGVRARLRDAAGAQSHRDTHRRTTE